jgi:hypothetical protein
MKTQAHPALRAACHKLTAQGRAWLVVCNAHRTPADADAEALFIPHKHIKDRNYFAIKISRSLIF